MAEYLSGFIKKVTSEGAHVLTFSGLGDRRGMTSESEFCSFGRNGLLYVPEAGNNRISVFNQAGEFQFTFGSYGSGDGELNRPEAAKCNSQGLASTLISGD